MQLYSSPLSFAADLLAAATGGTEQLSCCRLINQYRSLAIVQLLPSTCKQPHWFPVMLPACSACSLFDLFCMQLHSSRLSFAADLLATATGGTEQLVVEAG